MEVSNCLQAARFLESKIGNPDVEEFWAVALNPVCRVLDAKMLFRGTVDCCFIHPRDVFRFAIASNASSLIVGHNHPSGSCFPSRADVEMTKRLRDAGRLLQIALADHIIIAPPSFYSFAEKEWKVRKSV